MVGCGFRVRYRGWNVRVKQNERVGNDRNLARVMDVEDLGGLRSFVIDSETTRTGWAASAS